MGGGDTCNLPGGAWPERCAQHLGAWLIMLCQRVAATDLSVAGRELSSPVAAGTGRGQGLRSENRPESKPEGNYSRVKGTWMQAPACGSSHPAQRNVAQNVMYFCVSLPGRPGHWCWGGGQTGPRDSLACGATLREEETLDRRPASCRPEHQGQEA